MSIEANKALIRRYMEAVDTGDVNIVDEFVAPDFVDHSPFPGMTPDREGLKQAFRFFLTATPGYHTVHEVIAEGDMVAARITGWGRHEGELLGIPATGKDIQMSGMVFWRIAGGKIVEHWSQTDMVGLLQQLGAMPPPAMPVE